VNGPSSSVVPMSTDGGGNPSRVLMRPPVHRPSAATCATGARQDNGIR
jgi:hypothetical protein